MVDTQWYQHPHRKFSCQEIPLWRSSLTCCFVPSALFIWFQHFVGEVLSWLWASRQFPFLYIHHTVSLLAECWFKHTSISGHPPGVSEGSRPLRGRQKAEGGNWIHLIFQSRAAVSLTTTFFNQLFCISHIDCWVAECALFSLIYSPTPVSCFCLTPCPYFFLSAFCCPVTHSVWQYLRWAVFIIYGTDSYFTPLCSVASMRMLSLWSVGLTAHWFKWQRDETKLDKACSHQTWVSLFLTIKQK